MNHCALVFFPSLLCSDSTAGYETKTADAKNIVQLQNVVINYISNEQQPEQKRAPAFHWRIQNEHRRKRLESFSSKNRQTNSKKTSSNGIVPYPFGLKIW